MWTDAELTVCGQIRATTVEKHPHSIIQGSNSLAAAVGFWIYPWTTEIQTDVSIVHEEALTLQDAKYSNSSPFTG